MLDNRYALLFIRGERPIMDEKFDIMKHPNIDLSADGKGRPYLHGEVTRSVASMELADGMEEGNGWEAENTVYLVLSEDELRTILN